MRAYATTALRPISVISDGRNLPLKTNILATSA